VIVREVRVDRGPSRRRAPPLNPAIFWEIYSAKISEAASAADAPSVVARFLKSLTAVANATDAASAFGIIVSAVSEGARATEAVSAGAIRLASLSETDAAVHAPGMRLRHRVFAHTHGRIP
jgi:hypothetical protein